MSRMTSLFVGIFTFLALLSQIWTTFMQCFAFFQDGPLVALGVYISQLELQIVLCRRLTRFFFLNYTFVSFWSFVVLALSANCKSSDTDPAVFY